MNVIELRRNVKQPRKGSLMLLSGIRSELKNLLSLTAILMEKKLHSWLVSMMTWLLLALTSSQNHQINSPKILRMSKKSLTLSGNTSISSGTMPKKTSTRLNHLYSTWLVLLVTLKDISKMLTSTSMVDSRIWPRE
jgi:hypothetical protein